MLRLITHVALAFGFVASASALVAIFAALAWIGEAAIRMGLQSRGGPLALLLAGAVFIAFAEAIHRLSPVRPARKTVRLRSAVPSDTLTCA